MASGQLAHLAGEVLVQVPLSAWPMCEEFHIANGLWSTGTFGGWGPGSSPVECMSYLPVEKTLLLGFFMLLYSKI